MGGFCPSKTCFRKSGKWQHGNVFIPEHLCFRIASLRFELSAGVRKIDLERSTLTFINFGDNVRIEDVVVLADSSKELRRTGLGEFVDRPEQRDAEALCRKFPNYVKNPRPLQSGLHSIGPTSTDAHQCSRFARRHFVVAQAHKSRQGRTQTKTVRHHGR